MIVASHLGLDCKAPPASYFETPCFVKLWLEGAGQEHLDLARHKSEPGFLERFYVYRLDEQVLCLQPDFVV